MKSGITRLALALALLSPLASGCAAPVDDDADDATAAAALAGDPTYDAVIRGGTKVEADATRTRDQSASTHLLGWIPNKTADKTLEQLFKVARWTEMRDPDGERPFTRADVSSDTTSGDARTIVAKLTLDGGVTLGVKGVATQGADGKIVVHITNTTTYKHWLAGTILQAEKLAIDVSIIPYQGGVMIDATMKVKLSKMEDKAAKLTGSIAIIFDWLKANR